VLRHITRERQSPDPSFASLPSIASRALRALPRVRPRPLWRLRVERLATAVGVGATALTLLVGIALAADWLTPYRVISEAAEPVASRVHLGKQNNNPPPAGEVHRVTPSHRTARRAGR
jgi:hypothetical protein